ncbi:MAG: hypothetical protein N2482_02335 [Patescibacteria group bacterium]|nr:hypothetical protein [Patescibacteria group bacterium]
MIGKKTIVLLSLFFALIGLNFYLIFQINHLINQEAKIKKILNEMAIKPNNNLFFNFSTAPLIINAQAEIKKSDGRVVNLKNFFRKYNSPLYDYAEKIVAVSDKYHFDYRLLPAIAMQESNLCRYIPPDSYNCWGWGIYGDQITKFSSYDEAIETVAYGIKKNYLDKGLITTSAIMQKYTPSSNGSWAHGVNTFLRALE